VAEGVISTAIAVLIVAFLGIALWKGFELMMESATERTRDQVEQIGG
jgi:type IV secretory pathway VirB2 component (pilin)